MLSTKNQTPPLRISDYGIAYANDFYTLAELVKAQIKKGFQPCTASGVSQMMQGQEIVFVQVMVKYSSPKSKSISKSKKSITKK